jgi:hypothetical protein
MYEALILLLAAAEPTPVEAIDYTLPAAEPAKRIVAGACDRGGGGEIVVCGRSRDRHRLGELPPSPTPERRQGPIGADLPFGRVEPKLETVARSDGWIDKRAMVTLKMPF